MNKRPKVSACIITYNQEEYIKDCIEGALMQITDDYEIVIGDDCSTDNTSAICQEYQNIYPNRIKYYRREKNLGMMGNWIQTIKDCSGEYIALCEGDDYWTDPHKLQKQVDFLEANEEYVVCAHRCYEQRDKEKALDELNPNGKRDFTLTEVIYKTHWHTPSLFFRNHKVLKNLPAFMRSAMPGDRALTMLLMKHAGNSYYFEDSMGVYRLHTGGTWSTDGGKKHSFEYAITLIRLYEYLDIQDRKLRIAPFYRLADYVAQNGYNKISWLNYQKELWRFFGFKGLFSLKRIYLLAPIFYSKLNIRNKTN